MIDFAGVPPNDSSKTLIRIAPCLLAIALLAAACGGFGPRPAGSIPAGAVEADESARAAASDETDPNAPPSDASGGRASAEAAARTDGEAKQESPATGEGDAADESGSPEEDPSERSGDDEKEAPADRNITLETEYDDARVGEEETPLIEAELGLVQDEALTAYVRSVALRLLRHAPSRPFEYEFKIVDQSVPNAFALPGGKIYVSRGLLALVTSEDELAGVLGHEITHAAERHAAARQEYGRRLNPFSIGLLRAAKIAAYGRDQERDADRGGQLLAAQAGYDPRGIARFLRKLDAAERYEIGWSRLPSFFATHPTSPERSAMPTPSMATRTVPRGAKPVKLVTRFVPSQRSPSGFSRLTAAMSAACPGLGLGCSTWSPDAAATAEIRAVPRAKIANRVTGWGSRLPSHSTTSRKRANRPERGRSEEGGAVMGRDSMRGAPPEPGWPGAGC